MHLNGQYTRNGMVDANELLIFSDVTTEVDGLIEETWQEVEAALSLLESSEIDESSCSCINLTKSNHCDVFSYFNPSIPEPSIYNIPRISKKTWRFCN